MLNAIIDGRLLSISGTAARTDAGDVVRISVGAGTAEVRDADGSAVTVGAAVTGVLDLDLSALTGAGALVAWVLGGPDGTVARIDGSPLGDQVTLSADPASALRIGAVIHGGGGDDALTGSLAAEELRGGAGRDTLLGGDGEDRLAGEGGDDLIDGGAGSDTALFTGGAAITVDLRLTGPQVTGQGRDTLLSIDNVTTAWGDDLLIGNDADNVLSGGQGIDTMIGGAGDDTYAVSHAGDVVSELQDEGHDTIRATCSWTLGDHVEDLVLIGAGPLSATGNALANRLAGNGAANTLSGGAGDDTLEGGGGADWLIGGLGDDVYDADSADVVVEHDGEGRDRMRAQASIMLAPNIEELELTGTAAADGTGNELDNLMLGNAAANRLDGGGGADTLAGGNGDDVYVHDPADTIIELPGEGEDEVLSDVTAALPEGLEHLTLTGPGIKDAIGNSAANRLRGNDDDNILDGGEGEDTLIGGLGHDTYILDAGDLVIEAADGGIDTVISALSFALPDHVENLVLRGAAHAATGNDGDNRLEGTAGANILDGGAGSDTLAGGAGDDAYIVDGSDRIEEGADGGWDSVTAADSFELPDHVEELTLVGISPALLRGNAWANIIRGNAAANVLDGRGGADSLIGGTGDDVYLLHGGEVVTELAQGGHDIAIAWAGVALAEGVEDLYLSGELPISGTGNAGNNLIAGNAAGNVLTGGAGADTLQGGGGDDVYHVDAPDTVAELAGQGTDVILSPVSMILPANVEMLGLTGTGDVNATGNTLDNRLVGNAGRNVLMGGLGADSLLGGAGDDIYMCDGRDRVVEAAGAGWDTQIGWNAILMAPNVEAAILRGTLGATITGNALDNVMTGNDGANALIGNGGRDRMIGGAGNDLYLADASDVIVEARGGGWDTVRSSQSFRLPPEVEALVLTGTQAVAGFGNGAANRIGGTAAANWIDGGAGADTLFGGGGNDIYVAGPGDVILEGRGGGIDTVRSAFSHVLAAEVENLTMLGAARAGVGNQLGNAINGNAVANVLLGQGGRDSLIGGAGNDRLDGGADADRLTGGAGADVFVFSARSGLDAITDFTNGADRIEVASGAERFSDLALADRPGGVLIRFADTAIFLSDVSRAMLGAEDFVFS